MNVVLALCALLQKRRWTCAFLLGALALPALFLRPIDALTIRLAPSAATNEPSGRDTLLFMASAPLGQEFLTEYIHSVQLTPVQDVYRIVDGRIWAWQERVQSHNAGLPFARPPFGRFRAAPPWMIFEGGRQSWESIVLRVGNAELGRNIFSYGAKAPRVALYERFPGKRLQLRVERRPLMTLLFQSHGIHGNVSIHARDRATTTFGRAYASPEPESVFDETIPGASPRDACRRGDPVCDDTRGHFRPHLESEARANRLLDRR
ncbi:MAG: DUF1850 domain-containing protein [Candidatus Accumulibacter sp.]|jgi:hypothetical protein|nr:DUF1850 domain-containing protein [Accumulibacter sp.]